jgi:hypothetical protein
MMARSKRASMFKKISDAERKRLDRLVSPVKTVKDALRVLGPADLDQPYPKEFAMASRDRGHVPSRTLIYTRLSKVADVHVGVGRNQSAQLLLMPKRR